MVNGYNRDRSRYSWSQLDKFLFQTRSATRREFADGIKGKFSGRSCVMHTYALCAAQDLRPNSSATRVRMRAITNSEGLQAGLRRDR